MEQIIKHLNSVHGLDNSILTSQAKEICDLLGEYAEQEEISFIGVDKNQISAGYQIPLRQHSSSIAVKYDYRKPEKGVDLEVQLFGNDEHTRWDQAVAVGALLAYDTGKGFTEGSLPEIDFSKPEGVKFSLHIDPDLKPEKIDQLIQTLTFMIKQLTMSPVGGPDELFDILENGMMMHEFKDKIYTGIGQINWNQIPEECFQHTLWLNLYFMEKFKSEGNDEMLSKVAVNSLIGISKYKIDDYKRQNGKSLKSQALKQLNKIFTKNKPCFLQNVWKFRENPYLAKYSLDTGTTMSSTSTSQLEYMQL